MILATAFKHNWKWLKIAISKLHLKNAKIHLLGFTGTSFTGQDSTE